MERPVQIAICDDSAQDRALLQACAQKWALQTGHALQIRAFASAESFLFHYEEKSDYDILLLDIEMGRMDGVALAKQLRKENETVQIVFVTGYSDYISEGYEVSALHYLLKPVSEEKLLSVLSRAMERLQKAERLLTLDQGGAMARIPLRQIRYADVRLNYVTVHAGEDYTVKMTLSELALLLDERFYRVGRSFIVNLDQIRQVSKTQIILSDSSTVPLPRGAYEGVNRAIINLR